MADAVGDELGGQQSCVLQDPGATSPVRQWSMTIRAAPGAQGADRKLDLGKLADLRGRHSAGIAAVCFRPQGLDLGTEVGFSALSAAAPRRTGRTRRSDASTVSPRRTEAPASEGPGPGTRARRFDGGPPFDALSAGMAALRGPPFGRPVAVCCEEFPPMCGGSGAARRGRALSSHRAASGLRLPADGHGIRAWPRHCAGLD